MDSFSRSTLPDTPRPETLAKSLTGYRWRFRSSAADVTASARGCSDTPSSEAAYPKMRSSSNSGSKDSAASRRGLPSVNVPVLSNTSTSRRPASSRAVPFLTSTPICAPRPVATIMEMGVARPSAHGQATTSTATKIRKASETGTCPQYSHPAPAMTASAMTVGTKMRLTSSASRAMGALELCASRTSFMIRDKAVSAPTRSARIIKEPVVFIVPPATELLTPTGTGMDSPVSMEASTLDAPLVTTPSTGIRPPGFTCR